MDRHDAFELVGNLLDGFGGAGGDDGDARQALKVGDFGDRQAFDVVAASGKQADDAGEHAGLVVDEHRKDVGFVALGLAGGGGVGRKGGLGVHGGVPFLKSKIVGVAPLP